MKTTAFFFFLSLSIKIFALNSTVGNQNADYITDGIADEVEIQAAIDAVANNGGGTVTLLEQVFTLNSRIVPRSNVVLVGAGVDKTRLIGMHTFDYVIFNNKAPIDNFHLQGVTIDANNAEKASGVRLNYATNCTINKVKFVQVTCDGWHLVIGIHGDQPEILQSDFSNQNLITDCEFDGHSGSLEMLLIFNTKNSIIQNCVFKNKIRNCPNDGNAPVVGLWQRTDHILIKNCQFLDNESSEAIYYSSSSFNTIIEDCSFNNTGSIRGANDSDWEAVNELYDYAEGLKIESCAFIGGSNDRTKMAIQLGRIRNVLIKDCSIEQYEEGITFQGGNTLAGNGRSAPKYWAVINTVIKNCNPNDDVHGLHGGALFTEGTNLNGFFVCGQIFDDQAQQTMRYPIIFEYLDPNIYPTQTYDSIFILGTELSPITPYNQIQFNHQVNRGADLLFEDCQGSSPANFCAICDTPQSMSTYTELIANYDATTAQKMLDLSALTVSLSSCNFNNLTVVIEDEIIGGEILGNEIQTMGNVTLNGGTTLKASRSIRLTSGFYTNSNYSFVAKIESCSSSNQLEQAPVPVPNNLAKRTQSIPTSKLLSTVFPNPFTGQAVVQFTLPEKSHTTISISDILGRSQQIINNQLFEKGTHQITLNRRALERGTYFLIINNGQQFVTHRLIAK